MVEGLEHVNFFRDISKKYAKELVAFGCSVKGLSDDEVVLAYLNVQKRIIPDIPRKVLKAKGFTCPHECLVGLALLENRIKAGHCLTPYLSRSVEEPFKNDSLLNDWNIYHLHLGVVRQRNGFIKRTGPLLFSCFDSENAYFLEINQHGGWSRQKMLEIVYENWPHLLTRANGVTGSCLSDSEVATLRKKNGNYIVDIKGEAFFSAGGGVVASGLSAEVALGHAQLSRLLDSYQNSFVNNFEDIQKQILAQRAIFPENPKFALDEFDGSHFSVREISSGLIFRVDIRS